MSSHSSASKLACAEPVEPVEVPRAKPLRDLTRNLVTEDEAKRTALSNRRAALKLLQLREEKRLTQVEAATKTRSVSSRTVGRYESAAVDLGALRYYFELLELPDQQKKGGR